MNEGPFSPCRHCGARWEPTITRMESGPHWAKETCTACRRFLRWLPKPDREKTKREAKHVDLVRKHGRGFCELCLIRESHLPQPQTLEAHHVIEYANGGDADRENILIVCTACHALIHWRRTYLAHLLPEGAIHVEA